MSQVINRKIHKDCPFTEKELMGFYDMLYNVNTAHHCLNPAHPTWTAGSQMFEQHCMNTGLSSEALLREENEYLRERLKQLERKPHESNN